MASSSPSRCVLSLFPGIGLLDMAFERVGWSVVRGPDVWWGGDIRAFRGVAGVFDGVIGGSPCQQFSALRRGEEKPIGREMLGEFLRVVAECKPRWWLAENVPRVPNLILSGYVVQRLDVRGTECGVDQRRLRHFQFGSLDGWALVVPRVDTGCAVARACLATEGRRGWRRSFPDFCEAMGLSRSFDLPGMTVDAKYRAVGNGVPLPMGLLFANAIRDWPGDSWGGRICACGCGRVVTGLERCAGPACRKRLSRRGWQDPGGKPLILPMGKSRKTGGKGLTDDEEAEVSGWLRVLDSISNVHRE
jgi:DNA (cytosine-5)-methyltransferase 1